MMGGNVSATNTTRASRILASSQDMKQTAPYQYERYELGTRYLMSGTFVGDALIWTWMKSEKESPATRISATFHFCYSICRTGIESSF